MRFLHPPEGLIDGSLTPVFLPLTVDRRQQTAYFLVPRLRINRIVEKSWRSAGCIVEGTGATKIRS